jgi:hypothetical protein
LPQRNKGTAKAKVIREGRKAQKREVKGIAPLSTGAHKGRGTRQFIFNGANQVRANLRSRGWPARPLDKDEGHATRQQVTTSSGGNVNGAIGDLKGDGIGGSLSPALQAIAAPGPHPLPTALIAGVYANFASLDSSLAASIIRLCPDPVAQELTSEGWPTIFSNNNDPNGGNNDAIVSETSQLNGLSSGAGFDQIFQDVVHSPGTENLGFSPPSVLDAAPLNGVPTWVIQLLNTPVNQPGAFTSLNP